MENAIIVSLAIMSKESYNLENTGGIRMRITGERIYLKPFQVSDVNQKLAFHLKNKTFFEGYSMERDERFYTLEEQQALIIRLEDFAASDVE